jgi:xanthine dehydrogenase accessory factor
MSLDPDAIRAAIARHGPVARVVVAEVRGSAPRERGAAMLVWQDGQGGTIGGGTLEWAALRAAREGHRGLSRHALGPDLGQCCGGAVSLWTETWDEESLGAIEGALHARGPGDPPASVANLRARIAEGWPASLPVLVDGWLVEAVSPPRAPLWIWGAGHVGRALAATLGPLPDFAITWVDDADARFPEAIPVGITPLVAVDMTRAVAFAPDTARHLVLTYSHQIDLTLCHVLLSRPSGPIGLIGSATKRARFRSRLRSLGHPDARISRIRCPIGRPELGRHPQAIAIGVASELLETRQREGERMVG